MKEFLAPIIAFVFVLSCFALVAGISCGRTVQCEVECSADGHPRGERGGDGACVCFNEVSK
jgi:hypothetical protein